MIKIDILQFRIIGDAVAATILLLSLHFVICRLMSSSVLRRDKLMDLSIKLRLINSDECLIDYVRFTCDGNSKISAREPQMSENSFLVLLLHQNFCLQA